MASDINTTLNQLETRLSRLESKTLTATTGVADVLYDAETGETTVADRLDWSVTEGWEPYATIAPLIVDEDDPNFPGGQVSSPYGRPEAYQLGRMCFLTGVARRSAATPTLSAGVRHDIVMFGLPADLRPMTNVLLPCLMGNGDPETLGVVGTAWVEIRSGTSTGQASAQVYYVAGTVALSPTTGWVALQGIFSAMIFPVGGSVLVANSWDDVHFMTTWDTVNPESTWDTFTTAH